MSACGLENFIPKPSQILTGHHTASHTAPGLRTVLQALQSRGVRSLHPPAMTDPARFEQARQHFLEGLAHLEAGRPAEAEQAFLASLVLLPGRVSTLVNLAATRLRLSRPAEALEAADAVIAQVPDDRDGWLHRATALALLGRREEALAAFDRLVALAPELPQPWLDRGSLLRELGRHEEAARDFRAAAARGAPAELTAYYLAAVGGEAAPPTAPRAYVAALFDSYAADFDQHLVGTLGYQGHAVLTQPLAQWLPQPVASALDLGCGTGLCAPALRPLARHLTGVDLSAGMLARARATGLYDALHQADLVEHLRQDTTRHDLVVAADVFIYVGALEPVFAALRPRLADGALFCFSLEEAAADAPSPVLQPSLRYAHSQAYVQALAAAHGLSLQDVRRAPVRQDQRHGVDGLFVYLRAG